MVGFQHQADADGSGRTEGPTEEVPAGATSGQDATGSSLAVLRSNSDGVWDGERRNVQLPWVYAPMRDQPGREILGAATDDAKRMTAKLHELKGRSFATAPTSGHPAAKVGGSSRWCEDTGYHGVPGNEKRL